jgi:DNA-binding SARP family transcriptional activator
LLLERKKTRALLAMLALDPGHMLPRGKITTVLWPEQSEDAARHALRQCLLDLRQVLAKANLKAIRAEGDLIGLDPSRVVVDTARFEHQVAHGTPEALQDAVALYCGDLLEGFNVKEPAFEDWLRAERERLRSLAVEALKKLLAHYVGQNVTGTAAQFAIRLLALEPFDEAVHRALMSLYAESGRRSAALRQYEECVELLGRELGVEPEAETRELYSRLIADHVRLPSASDTSRTDARVTRTAPPPLVLRPPPGIALVGRQDDLKWLEDLRLHAQRGQPQLALLIGEAGVGKSRLVGELAFRAQRHKAEILLGRGREGEDILPFAPWIEALRPRINSDLLGQLSPVTRTDLTRLFVEFAGDSVPPSTGLDDGPRIFEAVAQLLRELSATRLVAVVLEDLHWCDNMTVRLLRFLPRRLTGCRVLLLSTARPEELVVDPDPAAHVDVLRRDPSCSSRALGPLSRDEAVRLFRALLAQRTEALPEALFERMWALSEGNPFVVVECARAVRDQCTAGRAPALDLPEEVRTLTARSLAGLSDRASRLADLAAVIGRDLDVRVLEHAAELTEHELADGVEELVRRRVLRQLDGRFDFGHDRLREVAYRRLLEPRRVLLHRRVGEAMEAVYAADLAPHYAIIGAHYRQASVWPQACRYQARAGFAALERGAGREALACFDYALQAIPRLPDTVEWRELDVRLRLAANGASMTTGNYEGGRPYLLQAERVAATLADARWQGRVAAAVSSCVRASGELERALHCARRALEIACQTQDRPLENAAKFVLAMSEHNAGDFRRSLEHLAPLLAADSIGWNETFVVDRPHAFPALARYWMVFSCVQLGEFDRAMRLVEEGLSGLSAQNDMLGTQALFFRISHGRALNAIGDFDAAVRAYETAFGLYREDCHGNFYSPLAWGLGLAYALAGRVRESLEQFERAEAIATRRGTRAFSGMWLLHLGRALIEAGRFDEAAQMAREALDLSIKSSEGPSKAGALGLLGEVARRRDPVPYEEMEHHLLGALTLAEPLGMRPLVARCHLRLAWLYSTTGRADGARHSATAESLLRQMGRPRSLDAAAVH